MPRYAVDVHTKHLDNQELLQVQKYNVGKKILYCAQLLKWDDKNELYKATTLINVDRVVYEDNTVDEETGEYNDKDGAVQLEFKF